MNISRFLLILAVLICTTAVAATPGFIQLDTGKKVPVLSITKTTLHISNEPVLVLKYQTDISFSDMQSLYSEAERVWAVFQNIANKENIAAAIVFGVEKKTVMGVLRTERSAGWVWKKGAEGLWHEPKKGDRALTPKEQ